MGFTDTQVKALSGTLSAKHVRTRQRNGMTLSYVEGWHVIAEANRIFGFYGWDRETIETRCVWEGVRKGRSQCAYTARVRIRVCAGDREIVREGSGFGQGSGATPGEAHENTLKEAETDAMKRALVTFGNPFGLALYDKEQRGVRGRKCDGMGRPAIWSVVSGDGGNVSTHDDPVECFGALRQLIEAAKSLDEVEAIWARNSSTVAALRLDLPDLKSPEGEHYSGILTFLFQQRRGNLMTVPETGQSAAKGDAESGKAEKVVLPLPKLRRVRDKEHLRYVASLPCLVCGRTPGHAHHVRLVEPSALGRKPSDHWTVPLCAIHHRSLHDAGNERNWWDKRRIDPVAAAEHHWQDRTGGHAAHEEARQEQSLASP